VLRRNGYRIVADYGNSSVTFRLYKQNGSIATVDFAKLRKLIENVKRVSDYAAVDDKIARLVAKLEAATE